MSSRTCPDALNRDGVRICCCRASRALARCIKEKTWSLFLPIARLLRDVFIFLPLSPPWPTRAVYSSLPAPNTPRISLLPLRAALCPLLGAARCIRVSFYQLAFPLDNLVIKWTHRSSAWNAAIVPAPQAAIWRLFAFYALLGV